jgi:DNA-binding PadR family transcriptional regulator
MKILRKRTQPSRLADARDHLPMRPVAFAVLAALAAGPCPGIDILDEVNATVPRHPILGPGTLYRLLRELRQEGLIAREARVAHAEDERQAHHALTPLGRAVLKAESGRLRRTLGLASATGRR